MIEISRTKSVLIDEIIEHAEECMYPLEGDGEWYLDKQMLRDKLGLLLQDYKIQPRSGCLYRVFQDGKRCAAYGNRDWQTDTFDTMYQAEIFALRWACLLDKATAKANHKPMLLGVEYDFGVGGIKTMMKIEKINV